MFIYDILNRDKKTLRVLFITITKDEILKVLFRLSDKLTVRMIMYKKLNIRKGKARFLS